MGYAKTVFYLQRLTFIQEITAISKSFRNFNNTFRLCIKIQSCMINNNLKCNYQRTNNKPDMIVSIWEKAKEG